MKWTFAVLMLAACSGDKEDDTTTESGIDSGTVVTDTDLPDPVDTDTTDTDTPVTPTGDTGITEPPATDVCTAPACGGNLQGTWEATSDCGDYYNAYGYVTTTSVSWPTPLGMDYAFCPSLISVDYSTNLSLTFDGANNVVTESGYTNGGSFELDEACLTASDATCQYVADWYNSYLYSYGTGSYAFEMECLDNALNGCDCTYGSGYGYSYSYSYTSDGVSSFVFDGQQYEYCVIGDEMYFGPGGLQNRQSMQRVQ